jgi:hypothetical protein
MWDMLADEAAGEGRSCGLIKRLVPGLSARQSPNAAFPSSAAGCAAAILVRAVSDESATAPAIGMNNPSLIFPRATTWSGKPDILRGYNDAYAEPFAPA